MTKEEIYVKIGIKREFPHPDLIALSTILICHPFVSKRLKLPLPVSRYFIDMVTPVITKYDISYEIDDDLIPLKPRKNGLPGLAFSGGADSCAALQIMPKETKSIFLKRPEEEKSLYDLRSPLKICEILTKSGFDLRIVETNLEKIRDPVGFPTDLANAVPAILLSQELELDSIAFGTVLESAFGIGHQKYIDYKKGAHWRFYSNLFASVGLYLNLPVCGISEVGTALIGQRGEIASISQSCIRGDYEKPCLKCWKCFRKELLLYSLGETTSLDFQNILRVNEVQKKLSSYPISHENVVNFSLSRIDLTKHHGLKKIKSKMNKDTNLVIFEKWYPDSGFFIPDKYFFEIRDNIMRYIKPMDSTESNIIRNWDMTSHLRNQKTIEAQENLIDYWQNIN